MNTMLRNYVAGDVRDMNEQFRDYNFDDQYAWGWMFDSFGFTNDEANEEIHQIEDDEDDTLTSYPENTSNVPIEKVYPDDAHLWQYPHINEEIPIRNDMDSVFGRRDFGSDMYFQFMRRNSGRNIVNDFASTFKQHKDNFKERVANRMQEVNFENLGGNEVRKEVLDMFEEEFTGVITEQGFVKRVKGVLRLKSRYELIHLHTDERSVYRTWTTLPERIQKDHKSIAEFHHLHVEDLIDLYRYAHKQELETDLVVEHVNLAIDGIVPGEIEMH